MQVTTTAAALKPVDVAKLTPEGSIYPGCGWGLAKDQTTAIATHNKKTIPTRSINGSAGNRSFIAKDNTADPTAASRAPVAVVLPQNIPNRKMATMPGVKKPVNS
jgi:hypothetical protein